MKKKIVFREQVSITIKTQYEAFILAQTARGVSAATIKSYHYAPKAAGSFDPFDVKAIL